LLGIFIWYRTHISIFSRKKKVPAVNVSTAITAIVYVSMFPSTTPFVVTV
jgi:hypothetical protein